MKSPSPNLCVGIAGGSCSGKSTLESGLREQLGSGVSLVSFDDFFVGLKALNGVEVDNWDDPKLYRFDEYGATLSQLRDGQSAHFEPHSSESKAEGISMRVIEPSPLIIATGFLALHDQEVNKLFDVIIFINLPEKEIVRRRLARAALRQPGPWNSDAYINETLIPSHRRFIQPQAEIADYLIDGQLSRAQICGQVLGIIDSLTNV